MNVDELRELLTWLTGRPIRTSLSDDAFLAEAVKNDDQTIDWSQFNELLLIANKDRVEEAFFKYFFVISDAETECSVKDLRTGVEKFQKTAMVCFGNFIYAYRTLSKTASLSELKELLGSHCHDSFELEGKLSKRRRSILGTLPIDKDRTYLLGYISSGEIREEHKIATGLDELLRKRMNKDTDCWLLKERLTQSVYRVVTNSAKLTNCFWNFYPEKKSGRDYGK
jgi:hypothetical protein